MQPDLQRGEAQRAQSSLDPLDLLLPLAANWRLLAAGPLVVGLLALGAAFLIKPTFTAKTVFLPPQQQQSAAASALASLGSLTALAGGTALRTAGDQYVSLLQSATVEDRLVDRFKLMPLYQAKYRFEARKTLEQNTRIALGKKDGLITIEVDALDPQMAADMANQYVAELRRLSSELALTEAQQRRAFFENELKQARNRLATAQQALQTGGFNPGALKAEPKAAADAYARIKAELTNAEVRLQTMRRSLADNSPEVQQQLALVGALRTQLAKVETANDNGGDADYVGRYRDFKYQETLFDLLSKQYEAARMDESREGALIQVVDVATPPEYKSKPKKAMLAITSTIASLLLLVIWVLCRHFLHRASDPNSPKAGKWLALKQAWRGNAA